MWYLRRVEGESMHPTYRNGSIILVSQVRNYRVGDVVVAFMDGREVLKRVTKLQNNSLFLEGDNAAHSTDSRMHGWIVDSHISGKVIWPKRRKPM